MKAAKTHKTVNKILKFLNKLVYLNDFRHIGVGRFRILGGQGLEFFLGGGPKGGPNSQQAQDVVTTSMRRNDVASTSFRRRVPIRFLINQCQQITFLILKYDIENSRIELRGIVSPVQMGGLFGGGGGGGGGGAKGILPPPLAPLFLRLCAILRETTAMTPVCFPRHDMVFLCWCAVKPIRLTP